MFLTQKNKDLWSVCNKNLQNAICKFLLKFHQFLLVTMKNKAIFANFL